MHEQQSELCSVLRLSPILETMIQMWVYHSCGNTTRQKEALHEPKSWYGWIPLGEMSLFCIAQSRELLGRF